MKLTSIESREPTYRFHGKTPPKDEKHPIVSLAPDGKVEDGVAKLHLYDPIDSWGGSWGVSAKEFKTALDSVKDADEIHLHINSPGGEVFEGVAILNQLRAHKATVTAVVDGIAASAASFIAAGADQTIMAKNSQMMIHDASGLVVGNASDMHSFGDVLDKISDNIASVYAEKSGGTVKDWRAAMLDETWYSDEEAVAAGLADSVVDAPAVENGFDLSMFRHGGRADAPAPPIPTQQPNLSEFRHRLIAARYRLPV